MNSYILDTDHITLYQEEDAKVTSRINALPSNLVVVTIISFEEQVRGRLATIRRANTSRKRVIGYVLLEQTLDYFAGATVLPFTEAAEREFTQLRKQKIRVGSNGFKDRRYRFVNELYCGHTQSARL